VGAWAGGNGWRVQVVHSETHVLLLLFLLLLESSMFERMDRVCSVGQGSL
jgi:hypothetical protein